MQTVEARVQKKDYTAILFNRKRFVVVEDKHKSLAPHDNVIIKEYDGDEQTGRKIKMVIHIVDCESEGLKEGYAVVGICLN